MSGQWSCSPVTNSRRSRSKQHERSQVRAPSQNEPRSASTVRCSRECTMQEHRYSFDVDATPEEIWGVMHQRPTDRPGGQGEIGEFGPIVRLIEHGPVTIEILHEGDEHGAGLVRHCFFRVPKYLLSGGVAQSWEHVTDVVPYESAKYYAIGKPLWSRADGEHRLEPSPRWKDKGPLRGALPRLQPADASPARAARSPLHLEGQRPTRSRRHRQSTRGDETYGPGVVGDGDVVAQKF